jgi:replicative DNA helicase
VKDFDFSPVGDKALPQIIEGEEAILGGIFLDPEALDRVIDILSADAFYISSHQSIYKACIDLKHAGKATDLLSVTNWLSDHDMLDKVGGRNKLASLMESTVSAVNIDAWAQLVIDKYHRRHIIKAGWEIERLGYETETDLSEVFRKAEAAVMDVTSKAFGDTEPVPLSNIMVDAFARIEERATAPIDSTKRGYSTGFYDLDTFLIGGLKKGKLYTVAARPGCGKSSFLGNVALNLGHANRPCVVFSMEMDKEEWGDRFLSQETPIESSYLLSGRISEHQWQDISKGIATLQELPILIDDSSTNSITAICAKVRRLIAQYGELGMVGIDYLGLIDGVDDGNNLANSIGKVTKKLKQFAREYNVPIVLLCQLNRGVEGRQNKRPTLQDLRDSGRIEEDSDVVIGLYRDELYNSKTTEAGLAEVILLKHRGGPSGTIKLLFDGQFSQFKNLARSTQTNSDASVKPSEVSINL